MHPELTMSTGFSDIKSEDLFKKAGGPQLSLQETEINKKNRYEVRAEFMERLGKVQAYFNLDRSEAARRIYIDQFILEALERSESQSLIITPEENIAADRARVGHGPLDYLASAIDSETENPIYWPSVVIEAKRGHQKLNHAFWQMLAQIFTLHQVTEKNELFRGVASDGRYWTFAELHILVDRHDNTDKEYTVFHSPRLDSANEESVMDIISLLIRFFMYYNYRDGIL